MWLRSYSRSTVWIGTTLTSLTLVEIPVCVPDENNYQYRQCQQCLSSIFLHYLQQGHYIHLSSFLVVPTQTQQSEKKTKEQLTTTTFVTKAASVLNESLKKVNYSN